MGARHFGRGLGFFMLTVCTLTGCSGEVEPEILAGVDACRECNMIIDQANQACGYVRAREVITFDSPGCLLRYVESLPREEMPPPEQILGPLSAGSRPPLGRSYHGNLNSTVYL